MVAQLENVYCTNCEVDGSNSCKRTYDFKYIRLIAIPLANDEENNVHNFWNIYEIRSPESMNIPILNSMTYNQVTGGICLFLFLHDLGTY